MEQVYSGFESAKRAAIQRAITECRNYSVYEDLTEEEAFYLRVRGRTRPTGSKWVFTTDYRQEASQDARQTAYEQEMPPGATSGLPPTSRANQGQQTTADENLREGRNVLDRLADAIEETGALEPRFRFPGEKLMIALSYDDWRRIHAIAAAMNNITAPLSE